MHKYTVELRVEGNALVPSDITAQLGLQPCQVREGNIAAGRSRRGKPLWAYDGFGPEQHPRQEWESLEDGLLFLLERLLPKQEQIQLNVGKFDVYWWCGHFQESFDGGPTFSPQLLRKLADFGVPLILDNYFSSDNEGVPASSN